jgi:hypothetical protein
MYTHSDNLIIQLKHLQLKAVIRIIKFYIPFLMSLYWNAIVTFIRCHLHRVARDLNKL